jgi:flagellin-like protein
MKINKKAISPVVATVLLIMIVIIIVIIILIWSSGYLKEVILKESGGEKKPIEQFCKEINLKLFIDNDRTFGVRNEGTVPIYAFKVKLSNSGETKTLDYKNPMGTINPGYSVYINDTETFVPLIYDNYEDIKIVPILLGKKQSGESTTYLCDNNEISLKE